MVDIEITFSPQAELLLAHMKDITKEELINWQISKGVVIGGGDIILFLQDKYANR